MKCGGEAEGRSPPSQSSTIKGEEERAVRGMTTPTRSLEQAAIATDESVSEYRAIVEGSGVYEEVGRGKVRAVGTDVLDLLNRLSTNRVDRLREGEGAPTIFANEKGRIIDLVYVLNLGPFVLLVTGAGAQGKVMEWVDRYTFIEDSELEDVTDSMGLVSVAGPGACEALEAATGLGLGDLGAWQSVGFEGDGIGGWVVAVGRGGVAWISGDCGGWRGVSVCGEIGGWGRDAG